MLFILYAEDRDLLPVRDPRYDDYGLRERVRIDVGRRLDDGDAFSASATRYWAAIDDLCRAINEGDADIGLPPYNGGLFSRKRTPLLSDIRLGDALLAPVKRLEISLAGNVWVDESHGRLPEGPPEKLQLEVQFGTLEDKAIRAAASWRRP